MTSTTVAAAAFRLEHVSSSGEVTYADHTLTHADERSLTRYRRDHVGFVFQFYNLIPSLTARENVALVTDIVNHPCRPTRRWRSSDCNRARITSRRNCPAENSSGWRSRARS